MSKPLYGDKALELFFGDNPSPVATAMWAAAMRNNYENALNEQRRQVEFWRNMALGLTGEMVERGARIQELEREVGRLALVEVDNERLVKRCNELAARP